MSLDKLSGDLYKKYKPLSHTIIYGKGIFKKELDDLFDYFVLKLNRKENSLISYMDRKKDVIKKIWELSVESQRFKISYYVDVDLTSKLHIEYKEEVSESFQANFIENKVKHNRDEYVYFIKSEFGYKIGKTKNLDQRTSFFGVKLPFKNELHSYLISKNMDNDEIFFHKVFEDKRINGEWFKLSNNDLVKIELLSKKKGKYVKVLNTEVSND